MTSGTLALQVINQYRTRDILGYLGLRYYLENDCARRDSWAIEVSSHLTISKKDAGYFHSLHFKEKLDSGAIEHRDIFIPGPNEAYTEAALLSECAKHPEFQPHDFVFSYSLSSFDDTRGVYQPYFLGLQERHRRIAEICQKEQDSVVRYTDIKRFYPSISSRVANDAWVKACAEAKLPSNFKDLGLKLLSNHADTSRIKAHGKGLLTGPMLSHLIANLVLRETDEAMYELFPGRYFRYVDDVVLVGPKDVVMAGRAKLDDYLTKLDLELHDLGSGKDFQITAAEWLLGEEDFSINISTEWNNFSRNLKQFLIFQNRSHTELSTSFAAEGFRMPLQDYSVVVTEASYRQRISDSLHRHPWLLKTIFKQTTLENLLSSAQRLRKEYTARLDELLAAAPNILGYERKRAIPKIRYFSGRLLYLGVQDDLIRISNKLRMYPELHMLAEIMMSVATRNITCLLSLGSNAVQSAAQVLKIEAKGVLCEVTIWNDVELQGLAIIRAHGIDVSGPDEDELNRFALWGEGAEKLMNSSNVFIQELACLHGTGAAARHSFMLSTAFERAEDLAFDVMTPIDTY